MCEFFLVRLFSDLDLERRAYARLLFVTPILCRTARNIHRIVCCPGTKLSRLQLRVRKKDETNQTKDMFGISCSFACNFSAVTYLAWLCDIERANGRNVGQAFSGVSLQKKILSSAFIEAGKGEVYIISWKKNCAFLFTNFDSAKKTFWWHQCFGCH